MNRGHDDLQPSRVSVALRVSALVSVWAVAAVTLLVVPTTDHPERAAGIVEAAYRALGLFVLSAEGFPAPAPFTDAPTSLLWGMHFVAPVLTTTLLVDAARRVRNVLSGPERVASRADGHLVLCGFGNHGRLVVRHFLARHPDEEVVVLDNSASLPPFLPGPWDNPVPVLREDVAADARGALHRAGIAKASVVVASTGDDVLNVSICLTAREMRPSGLRLVALVHDDGMTSVLRATLDTRGVEMLDTHDLAAGRLVARLDATGAFAEPRALVIVGYGTFGQALCRAVLGMEASAARVPGMVVVDVDVDRKAAVPATERERVSFVAGNALDPERLAYVLRKAQACGGQALVALCTDDDTANLGAAFALRRQLPDGVGLLARLFRHPPADVASVLATSGIQCFELEDLLAERMAEVLA